MHRFAPLLFAVLTLLGLTFDVGPAEARPVYAPHMREPPNARPLCSAHVTGTTMHITWSSYALRQTVDEARAFYAAIGVTFTRASGAWSYAAREETRLSLHAVNDEYPTCAERPREGELSVLVRSRAAR